MMNNQKNAERSSEGVKAGFSITLVRMTFGI